MLLGLRNTEVGTWSVRTMFKDGKLENVEQERKILKFNILGLCETRWKGAEFITVDNYQIVHSGGENHERDVAIVMNWERFKKKHKYWAVSDRALLVKLKWQAF